MCFVQRVFRCSYEPWLEEIWSDEDAGNQCGQCREQTKVVVLKAGMDIVAYCSNGYEFHCGTDCEQEAEEEAQVEVRVHFPIMTRPEFECQLIHVQAVEELRVEQKDDACEASSDGHELLAAHVLSCQEIATHACHEHGGVED